MVPLLAAWALARWAGKYAASQIRSIRQRGNIQDEQLWGLADVAQIRQVVLKLLLNAVETVATGGRMHVVCSDVTQADHQCSALALSETPRDWCEVRIRDNRARLALGSGCQHLCVQASWNRLSVRRTRAWG
ncbi:hypothetical protein [Allorhodopirellula solitaria]|uniref:Uncharacterized protein n=1 Tax=Allorhodopirellula solitaria TaxID=2527987 RepID=A0A5C5XRZ0_9BACT|nr:hypothetical protein [Allorhodopirellula solitaria]TWT65143.1 hypothetical protein CA85_34910 [Allorhodopirellula solitaria]